MDEFSAAYWLEIASYVIPVIIAITFHEAAHGFVARMFGDLTAFERGRVTFNPFKHIDRFGTIVLPGLLLLAKSPILFGYAKPVPVDQRRLRNPKTDMIWVALAGPGINIVLAVVSALLLNLSYILPPDQYVFLYKNLLNSVLINCVLALFNMLPILPLDGGRVIAGLLPPELEIKYRKLERKGMVVVFLLLLIPSMMQHYGLIENTLFGYIVGMPSLWLYDSIINLCFRA